MSTFALRARRVCFFVVAMVVATRGGLRCWAVDDGAADPNAKSPEHDNGWSLLLGAMNYHAHLVESERTVNHEMNGIFGSLLPSWQEPTTFKDWSEDWKLWDLYFGVAKDIAPRWSWQATTGTGVGAIGNGKRYYPLGLPLRINIDFNRADVFAETGFNYYPLGKPVFQGDRAGTSGVGAALRATRPFLSLVGGYTWQHAVGDVQLSLPVAGRIARIKQDDKYDLFYIFPRLCFETPINARDSINFTAGYLLFDAHQSEFNSIAVGAFFKHKF